jgi:DNA-directed RNA polymerase subunit RPC12/RpoP
MPRLDNSAPEVHNYYDLEFDIRDPGATQPVDVCVDCYIEVWDGADQIDHPPYDEQYPAYRCTDCGRPLMEIDD